MAKTTNDLGGTVEPMAQNKQLGDWIYEHLSATVVLETAAWAVSSVQRVLSRLQKARPHKKRFRVEIPWLSHATAFTAPGRYVFISRCLFEMCRDDEMIAFVLAHEIAHHDLGHLRGLPDWFKKMTGNQLAWLLAGVYRILESSIYGPEQECDADRYGLELCLRAGYEAQKCLAFLDVLEKYALDIGDVDMVLGPDECDDELSDDASLSTKIRIWLYQRSRGYLPIQDRRRMLSEHLATLTNAPPSPSIPT
jgi:predicted Zn-dependent protease